MGKAGCPVFYVLFNTKFPTSARKGVNSIVVVV